jgi:hypothetical protein
MLIRKISIDTLIILYDLHSRLFLNVLHQISDRDAQNRLGTKANHVAWLAGSLVHERYELANAAGIQMRQTSDHLFLDHKGIIDKAKYPPLKEYFDDWQIITPVLRKALISLEYDELKSMEPYGVPGAELSFVDAITFIMDRESYCIGQIGLYRRLLGYEPMRYE